MLKNETKKTMPVKPVEHEVRKNDSQSPVILVVSGVCRSESQDPVEVIA